MVLNPDQNNKSSAAISNTIPVNLNVAGPSSAITNELENIRPYPKAPPRNNKCKRVRGKSTIYTDTPEKNS